MENKIIMGFRVDKETCEKLDYMAKTTVPGHKFSRNAFFIFLINKAYENQVNKEQAEIVSGSLASESANLNAG